jgi:precorrin-6B methylase 2
MALPGASEEPTPEARRRMRELVAGYWVTQMIGVVAQLRVADHLTDGPKSSTELAQAVGADQEALYRILRGLTHVGVLAEEGLDRFSLTPLGACLRTDIPDSLRDFTLMHSNVLYRAWTNLLHSALTGESAFGHTFGQQFFEYYVTHPDDSVVFNRSMAGIGAAATRAVLAAYDFSRFETLMDVGGGNGALLIAILQATPGLRGIVFDQPHLAEEAQARIAAAGLTERCEFVGGDFFAAVPGGADAYIERRVIHDWNDEQSITILRHCRQAMGDTGTLLLVEEVLPGPNERAYSKLLDVNMLALTGGKERTVPEYQALLEASGFELRAVHPTPAQWHIVEAAPR